MKRRWWLRWPRRRSALVIVDAAAYERALELAVVGEALKVLFATERAWLLMDTEDAGPWDD